ncbi:MAG: hypothetical protein WAN52_19540 [Pseudolabrys sp.]|jgi:hypothetical protein
MTVKNNGQRGCEIIQFGRRPIPPRACVFENRTYVRIFLADMLDALGFIAREAGTSDIRTVLRDFRPDLIVLGPLGGALEVQAFLKTLQAQVYGGTVMLFGGRSSEALICSHEFGEQSGLTMLPPLGTPFRARDLDANLERFLPIKPPPPLPIDVDESLCNGWLELWYQSKIDPQTLVPQGAEALVCVSHPTWGSSRPPISFPPPTIPTFMRCRAS